MNRTWMVGFGIGCSMLVTCLAAAEQAPQVAELQGRWEVVELVEDGKVVPREAIREWLPSGGKLEISENAVIFTDEGDRQVKLFSVDATRYPRQIDLVSKDKTDAVGICRIDDGKLVLCLADPAEASRPDDFSSKEGSHRMLMVLAPVKNARAGAAPNAEPTPPAGVAARPLTDEQVTQLLKDTCTKDFWNNRICCTSRTVENAPSDLRQIAFHAPVSSSPLVGLQKPSEPVSAR